MAFHFDRDILETILNLNGMGYLTILCKLISVKCKA